MKMCRQILELRLGNSFIITILMSYTLAAALNF